MGHGYIHFKAGPHGPFQTVRVTVKREEPRNWRPSSGPSVFKVQWRGWRRIWQEGRTFYVNVDGVSYPVSVDGRDVN